MTPRTKKPRPSLFPAYTLPEQQGLTLEEWAVHLAGYIRSIAMRLGQLVALLAALAGGTAYVASPKTLPTANDSSTIARVKALEDTVVARGRQINALEAKINSVLYIGCETLAKVQPAQSIPPQECRR